MSNAAGIDLASQARLIDALRRVVGATQVLETHLSYVLLTGGRAYKLKKAVDLGFVDFRTLASRRRDCERELEINRAFAPDMYLDVVAVTGSLEAPAVDGAGTALDYAVRMREFPQEALAVHALGRGGITPAWVDALAECVAGLHLRAAVDTTRAGAASVLGVAERTVERLREGPLDRARIDAMLAWTRTRHAAIAGDIDRRRAAGQVRACHGDLHLGNVATLDGRPQPFDAITFDDDLRFVDTMSDLAFLVMDFGFRGRGDLGSRLLDRYLSITGDYEGLAVLRFYLVHRALVRAMVAGERARQGNTRGDPIAEATRYLALAETLASPPTPSLVVTHGFSGSGKTTATQAMLERGGAIRVRTDVERKRLHRLAPTERGDAATLYADAATREVYRKALDIARIALVAGFPAIVDGAFLARWQRDLATGLAAELRVPFSIASFDCPASVLRERVAARAQGGNDASDANLAVLEAQMRSAEPLDARERAHAVFAR
jgi:aminoglycoside phosphotransferase family enzyme/predicted kinase